MVRFCFFDCFGFHKAADEVQPLSPLFPKGMRELEGMAYWSPCDQAVVSWEKIY